MLSLCPLAILFWQAGFSTKQIQADELKDIQEKTAIPAYFLRNFSNPDSIVQLEAQILKKRVEIEFRRHPNLKITSDWFDKKISKILRSRIFKPLPPRSIWAIAIPDGNPGHGASPCTGSAFEEKSRGFMTKLMKDVALQTLGKCKPLDFADSWEQRCRSFFGTGFSCGIFEEQFRSRPVQVICQDKTGVMTWNYFFRKKKIAGVFIIFMPISSAQACKFGIKTILKMWNHSEMFPVFLPLPTDFKPMNPSKLIHAGLVSSPASSSAHEIIEEFRQKLIIQPQFIPGSRFSVPRLLTSLVGTVIPYEKWWVRVCSLAPDCGHLGLLFVPRREQSSVFEGKAVYFFCGVMVLGWIIVLNLNRKRISSLNPGVEKELLIWLLALVSIPLILGISASSRLLSDRERNLKDGLIERLGSILEGIENDSRNISRQDGLICGDLLRQKLSDGKSLIDLFDENFSIKNPSSEFLRELWEKARSSSLKPIGLFLFGPNDSQWQINDFGMSPRMVKTLQSNIRETWAKELPGSSIDFQKRNSGSKIFGSLSIGDFNRIDITTATEKPQTLELGQKNLIIYSKNFEKNQSTKFVIVIVWDQKAAIRGFIKTRIRRGSISELENLKGFGMAAFTNKPDGMFPIARYGNIGHLQTIVNFSSQGLSLSEKYLEGRAVGFAYPSKIMSGIMLAAKVSLGPVQQQIRQEKILIFLLFAGVILQVFLVARLLEDTYFVAQGHLICYKKNSWFFFNLLHHLNNCNLLFN
ncbi:MAG: hypothetical protein HQM08_17470 [Candidatus Riflebacteria bacterium]|nr:hypothetical protein [Candidatus Riflebacteria bacterium]